MRSRNPKACKLELTANKTRDFFDCSIQFFEEFGNGAIQIGASRNLLNLLVDSLCFDGHTYFMSGIAALSRARGA